MKLAKHYVPPPFVATDPGQCYFFTLYISNIMLILRGGPTTILRVLRNPQFYTVYLCMVP